MNRIDTPILLLSANFLPVAVVSAKAAVGLLMADKVAAVDENIATVLRTPSTEFKIPSVVRLRVFHNVPKRHAVWSRRGVLRRDKFTCIFCGVTVGDEQKGKVLQRQDFTVDHLHPSSRGGKSSWMNCAYSCYRCNHRKASRTPNEAGMKLRYEPKTPRVHTLIASGEVPSAWKIYIETKG